MSANSATGSPSTTVQIWKIDSDVENQLHSDALRRRLKHVSLSHGTIELSLRCSNLIAVRWGEKHPFCNCHSLLRVDLSGLPKLESILELTFSMFSSRERGIW